jgi:hypothetical protein
MADSDCGPLPTIGSLDDIRITCTVPQFRQVSGLGESTTWELISQGKLQTIAVGRRRLIILDSYRRLIREQLAAGPGDCRRNPNVPALGSGRSRQQRLPGRAPL